MNGANWADSSFALQDAVLGNSLGSAVNVMTDAVSVATIAWGGDTDGDGIPDNSDSDDDNDGIPDAQEVANINAAMSVIVNFLLSN